MAVPLVIPNGAQMRLIWTNTGQLAINVIGLLVPGSPTFNQALADAVGVVVKSAWTTHLAPRMGGAVGLAKVGIRDLRSANLPEYLDSGATVAGSNPGEPLPRAAAAVCTLRTAKTGKKFTGRVYIPGWTEADNDSNGAQAATVSTAIVGFLQAVDTGISGNGIQLGVISRPSERVVIVKTTYHADGTSTVETVSDQSARIGQVTDVAVFEARNSRWEYQRRRDNGRGELATAFGGVARATSTRN